MPAYDHHHTYSISILVRQDGLERVLRLHNVVQWEHLAHGVLDPECPFVGLPLAHYQKLNFLVLGGLGGLPELFRLHRFGPVCTDFIHKHLRNLIINSYPECLRGVAYFDVEDVVIPRLGIRGVALLASAGFVYLDLLLATGCPHVPESSSKPHGVNMAADLVPLDCVSLNVRHSQKQLFDCGNLMRLFGGWFHPLGELDVLDLSTTLELEVSEW